jgi:hypothetical protein
MKEVFQEFILQMKKQNAMRDDIYLGKITVIEHTGAKILHRLCFVWSEDIRQCISNKVMP